MSDDGGRRSFNPSFGREMSSPSQLGHARSSTDLGCSPQSLSLLKHTHTHKNQHYKKCFKQAYNLQFQNQVICDNEITKQPNPPPTLESRKGKKKNPQVIRKEKVCLQRNSKGITYSADLFFFSLQAICSTAVGGTRCKCPVAICILHRPRDLCLK